MMVCVCVCVFECCFGHSHSLLVNQIQFITFTFTFTNQSLKSQFQSIHQFHFQFVIPFHFISSNKSSQSSQFPFFSISFHHSSLIPSLSTWKQLCLSHLVLINACFAHFAFVNSQTLSHSHVVTTSARLVYHFSHTRMFWFQNQNHQQQEWSALFALFSQTRQTQHQIPDWGMFNHRGEWVMGLRCVMNVGRREWDGIAEIVGVCITRNMEGFVKDVMRRYMRGIVETSMRD